MLSDFKKGWLQAENGERETGNVRMQESVENWRKTGARIGLQHCFVLLSESYGKAGQVDEGFEIVNQGFALLEENGGRSHEAELYRIKGELTLQSSTSPGQIEGKSQTSRSPSEVEEEAEECFLQAIEIAQKQQAKSLELRAVMSLVRLRQSQAQEHVPRTTQHSSRSTQHATRAKLDEAHQMLSEIYHWFTEGFDTRDLQEAKTLLEELS